MKDYRRIAIYVSDLDPSVGGMERVTYILSREFVRRGYNVYAIYINNLPIDKSLYSHYKGLCQGDSTKVSDIPGIIQFIKAILR